MKTITILVPALLTVAGVAIAQPPKAPAQRVPDMPVANAELRQAATGTAFRIGERKYRLAAGGVVAASGQAKSADAKSSVQVGKFAVEMGAKSAPTAASAGQQRMAAAVGASGDAVIVTSTLNVYVTDAGALQDAVRATGGKLTYASSVGGKGKIEYASVDEALKAIATIEGLAGVKEASPALVPVENTLY